MLQHKSQLRTVTKRDQEYSLTRKLYESIIDGDDLAHIKGLIKNGANIDGGNTGKNPLYAACKTENLEVAKLLLKLKANPDGKEPSQRPILEACSKNNTKMVELLLDAGANPGNFEKEPYKSTFNPRKEDTPLIQAILNKNVDIAKRLVKSGASFDDQGLNPFNPLNYAIVTGNKEIANLLIDSGANINYNSKTRINPLALAIKSSQRELTNKLLSLNCDVNNGDDYTYSPLFAAVGNQDVDLTKRLIKMGADVNRKDERRKSALHVALSPAYKYLDVQMYMFEKKVDIKRAKLEIKNEYARQFAKADVLVKDLVEAGLKPDIRKEDGKFLHRNLVKIGSDEEYRLLAASFDKDNSDLEGRWLAMATHMEDKLKGYFAKQKHEELRETIREFDRTGNIDQAKLKKMVHVASVCMPKNSGFSVFSCFGGSKESEYAKFLEPVKIIRATLLQNQDRKVLEKKLNTYLKNRKEVSPKLISKLSDRDLKLLCAVNELKSGVFSYRQGLWVKELNQLSKNNVMSGDVLRGSALDVLFKPVINRIYSLLINGEKNSVEKSKAKDKEVSRVLGKNHVVSLKKTRGVEAKSNMNSVNALDRKIEAQKLKQKMLTKKNDGVEITV